MPDRGQLDPATLPVLPPAPIGGNPWRIESARWAQITFEVGKEAALETLPCAVSRPVPCYARLFVLEAGDSPAGPFRMAALLSGGRYKMMPRNVLVEGIVDGPIEAIRTAFGAPFEAGRVSLEHDGARLSATVAQGAEGLATLMLPELVAIEPSMLRWDAWLGFATKDGAPSLIEYAPQPTVATAFLSKHATLETPATLPRTHAWRKFRNLTTISACYATGALTLTAPTPQEPATA